LQRAALVPALRPASADRCLAALGYAPWHWPPSMQRSEPEPGGNRGPVARLARAALRIRHTFPGRVLYRLAPKPLLNALKARLPS
jgi:hypothetical protein